MKKSLKIIPAMLLVLLMTMVSNMTLASDGIVRYKVTAVEDKARVRDFEYLSYDQVYRNDQEQAKNELLPADKESELLSHVPVGGMIIVELLGANWDMANGTNWTYVIHDDNGNELFRSKGFDHAQPPPAYISHGMAYKTIFGVVATKKEVQAAPEETPWGDRVYVVREQIEIPVALPDSFKVYVIDKLNKNRCCYALTKKVD
ncbi:MAG: hypothetical protein FDX30_10010 [Chlorobium sp.]|nr:MAG: hypothetical protein FDX30_10010 [Chlorobium sp.]